MTHISVIIPVYNTTPDLLERAVASADKQRAEKEVIVIDDGSDPALAEAYVEVIARYPSARLVRKPNGGVSSARNVGLAEAQGEWIGFLDADDVLTPEYLPEALDILTRSGADAVHGGYYYEYATGARDFYGQDGLAPGEYVLLQGGNLENLKGSLFDRSALAPLGLTRTNYCSSCCALFSKERAATLRFDESLTISEDRLFNYDFWSGAGSVALAGGVWYRYIENGESASRRLRPCAKEELLRTAHAYETLSEGASPWLRELVREGIVECYQQTLWFTVLHAGFKAATGCSAAEFARRLMDEPVYQRAFAELAPVGIKVRLMKALFQHRMAALTVSCFCVNGAIFKIKNMMKGGRP